MEEGSGEAACIMREGPVRPRNSWRTRKFDGSGKQQLCFWAVLVAVLQPTLGRPALYGLDLLSGSSGHRGELPQILGELGPGFWNKPLLPYLARTKSAGHGSTSANASTPTHGDQGTNSSSGLVETVAKADPSPSMTTPAGAVAGLAHSTASPVGFVASTRSPGDRFWSGGNADWGTLARDAEILKDLPVEGSRDTGPAWETGSPPLDEQAELFRETSFALEGATAGILKLAGWKERSSIAVRRVPPSPPVPLATLPPMGAVTTAVVQMLNTSGVWAGAPMMDPLQFYYR